MTIFWKTYTLYDKNTGQVTPVTIFLQEQEIYDKSYHHQDIGVRIWDFKGSECTKLKYYQRLRYLGWDITKEGLPRLIDAIDEDCKDPNPLLIQGRL